jgi:beta-barrel assembly-enhancing protease
MSRFEAALCVSLLAASAAACAGPTRQLASVAPEPVRAEQYKKQQVVIESDLRQQQRVNDVGHALLAAGTPFCGGALAPNTGVRFANVHSFSREEQDAARSLGFTDTLIVVGVASGSTAARSGFSVGDRVVALDGGPPPSGPNAVTLLTDAFAARPAHAPRLTLEQGGTRFLGDVVSGDVVSGDAASGSGVARVGGQLRVAMPADTVCAFNLVAARSDELNASADGVNVTVTSAMLRFVADDDDLAAVLAHQIAHNAMRHVQASQQDTTSGRTRVFSLDLEREADSVGMYLLARAGRPTARVPNLWRRIGREHLGNNKYASAHPTTPERFLTLEQMTGEIQRKIARGEELRPEPRGALTSPGTAPAQTAARSTTAKRGASRTSTVIVDRSRQTAALEVPKYEPPPPLIASSGEVSPMSTTTIWRSDSVSYTFGPPVPRNGLTVAQARRRAREAFDDGREAVELRLYERAEDRFREAVLYDGSDARYHGALGAMLLKRGKVVEAEAVLSAAVLLDVENAEYRRLLLDARKRD